MRHPLRPMLLLGLLTCPCVARADRVDDCVKSQMRKHHIPGLSLAIWNDARIVKARGYGVMDKDNKARVTPSTLFQAGSISKSVAALGALHLVEQGRLSLDQDVNATLTTWKVPENEFTKEKKVTLRGILSHTAGLTVHGFSGYGSTEAVPTLVQVLNGQKPANSPAIRVEFVPGSQWRYSGGGYTVMQQMIVDVAGTPFPSFMEEAVLKPLGMDHSTFEQPLPSDKAPAAATGYYSEDKAVEGRWHIYPEMAAAGLWTTASDLARFAMGVEQSLAGKANPVISQTITRQMLTDQKENDGLGVFLQGSGRTLRFTHSGRNDGFDAMLMAYAETGQGAAIMINANDDSTAVTRILEAIAQRYRWPDYPVLPVYKPIPDREPQVTQRIKTMWQQFTEGKWDKDQFTPEFAATIPNAMKQGMAEFFRNLGPLQSLALVERKDEGQNRVYRYRLVYKSTTELGSCTFTKDNKISGVQIQADDGD